MEHLENHLTAGGEIFFFLLITALVFWAAQRNAFFRLPHNNPTLAITFLQTLGAFLTYLIFAFLILPLILVLLAYWKTGAIAHVKNLPVHWLGWLQIGSLWGIFSLLILYCFIIKQKTRHLIFWGTRENSGERFLKGLGMGFLTWAISYPFVLTISLLAKYLSLKIWGVTETEQVAVRQLKMTMGKPVLFGAMVVAVVFIVPFLEELLFRGFFQNYAKRYIGRNWAIVLTAALFSLAHFSTSQGAGNFQLLISLFALALFLSFIYERENTLWAPIGLHTIFNGWNVLMIIFSKEI